MKKLLLIAVCILTGQHIYAQKFEISAQLNSGVAFYHGPGTESKSIINEAGNAKNNYTNNPYGNIQGPTYGASGDVKLVVASHLLFGVQAGYELSKTKIDIKRADHNFYSPNGYYAYIEQPVAGQTTFTSQYININPYFGYRIKVSQIAIDVMLGTEIANNLSNREKGSTTTTENTIITTDLDREKLKTDFRYFYGLKLWYRKFGISASYSSGTADKNTGVLYSTPGVPSAPHMVYMDVIKAGISYRFN